MTGNHLGTEVDPWKLFRCQNQLININRYVTYDKGLTETDSSRSRKNGTNI